MVVKGDELAERHREAHLVGLAERITPGLILKPRHKKGEAK
jgi:hypothetical protein